MTQTFKFKNGEILFDSDKIYISDDAIKQKRQKLFISIMSIIIGITLFLRSLKTGDDFFIWTGLLIAVGHVFVLIFTLIQTFQSEILLKEISSIKIKQRFGHKFIDIKLNNRKIRRILKIDNSDLIKFIETNFTSK